MATEPIGKRKTGRPRKVVEPGQPPGRGARAPGGTRQVAFVPTDKQRQAVMVLVAAGARPETIGELLRIPRPTLERHFRWELDHGTEHVNMTIGSGIAARALQGELTAQIFWAKARMGWRDRGPSLLDLPPGATVVLDGSGQPVSPKLTVEIR